MKNKNYYHKQIHILEDYIEDHLEEPLYLDDLIQVSGFSKYHFHRIFKALKNETIHQYILRVKLSRAAYLLKMQEHMSMLDIAYQYGFRDAATFSRAFKQYYLQSPLAYRKDSKICKEQKPKVSYTEDIQKGYGGNDMKPIKEVEIVHEELRLVYVRYTGSYEDFGKAYGELMGTLVNYMMKYNLIIPNKTRVMTLYNDHPDMNEDNTLRTSIAMSVPLHIVLPQDGAINELVLSGNYAVGHFNLLKEEYASAWEYMYKDFLLTTSYKPRDTFPFEEYVSEPSQNSNEKSLIDIYIAVE